MIAADLHILLHALSSVDVRESLEQLSLAATSAATWLDPTSAREPQKDGNPAERDCTSAITHLDGSEPRVGVNLIPVFGQRVEALVTYHGWSRTDYYLATERDYDLGRPSCVAHTPLQALRDLQSMLEDEHLADARRRDADFARAVARARP